MESVKVIENETISEISGDLQAHLQHMLKLYHNCIMTKDDGFQIIEDGKSLIDTSVPFKSQEDQEKLTQKQGKLSKNVQKIDV